MTLQSIYSKVWGHYCLYFALHRSRQISMSTIVHRFSKNTSKNDSLVKRFIEKNFPISFPKYRTDVNMQRATLSSVNRRHIISFQHILLNEENKVLCFTIKSLLS